MKPGESWAIIVAIIILAGACALYSMLSCMSDGTSQDECFGYPDRRQ